MFGPPNLYSGTQWCYPHAAEWEGNEFKPDCWSVKQTGERFLDSFHGDAREEKEKVSPNT